MTPGERIKNLRKEKGMTQKKLGELLNVSQQMVGQFERSDNLRMDTIEKIADALEVPVSKITGMVPEETETEKILSDILAIQKELEKIDDYFDELSEKLEKYYLYLSDNLSRIKEKISDK